MVENCFWDGMNSYTKELIEAIADISARRYIIVCNVETGDCWWSEKAAMYFGFDFRYFNIKDTEDLATVHPDDIEAFKKAVSERHMGYHETEVLEFRAKPKCSGEYSFFSMKSRMVRDENGTSRYMVVIVHNYGIREEIDEVTGLHNDISFANRINELIKEGTDSVIIKIEIEKFSHINVMYGAEYANRLLWSVARSLNKLVEGKGSVYRIAGIKFGFCLKPMPRDEIQSFYRAIVEMMSNNIYVDDRKIPLKISGGGLVLDGYIKDAVAVRSRLTYAHNSSKHSHHGDLVIFNDGACATVKDNLDLISTIHQCATNGCEGFYMCYQPIVNTRTGKIKGMEALLRWKKEPYGNIPPGAFIEWIEEDPCIFELGNWILERALNDTKAFAQMDPDFFVNVNISAAQIERHEFRDSVMRIIEKSELDPRHLCMELTERCRELDTEFLRNEINFFKSKGVKLAMDDFGTGNASLSVALNLPIDELKIDMSFVKDIKDKPVNQAMVQSIVEFAKKTNLETCIEGVEDSAVNEYLGQFGATWHQGYYYSKPVPIEDFKKMYMEMSADDK